MLYLPVLVITTSSSTTTTFPTTSNTTSTAIATFTNTSFLSPSTSFTSRRTKKKSKIVKRYFRHSILIRKLSTTDMIEFISQTTVQIRKPVKSSLRNF